MANAELLEQGDLVVRCFKRLKSKCDLFVAKPRDPTRSIQYHTVDQLNLKQDLLLQLHSILLPQLRQQILTLFQALEVSKLRQEPGLQLKTILETQRQLDPTLDQIFSASYIVCPEPIDPTSRTNDQHLKELKSYRLDGLYHLLVEFLPKAANLFFNYYQLIRELKLTNERLHGWDHVAFSKKDLVQATRAALQAIKSIINWLKGSEVEIVLDEFHNNGAGSIRCNLTFHVQQLQRLIDSTNRFADTGEEDFDNWWGERPLSDGPAEVAEWVIPIFKLARLFVNKLSSRRINRTRLPLYTDMSSYQLNIIGQLPKNVEKQLAEIMVVLQRHGIPELTIAKKLREEFKKLEKLFEAPSLLIVLYLLPAISVSDCLHSQNDIKTWFSIWNTQFSLGINNILRAISALDYDE